MEQWNKLGNTFSFSVLRVPPARNKGGTDGGTGGTRGVSVSMEHAFLPSSGCVWPVFLFSGAAAALPDVFRPSPANGAEETETPREQAPGRLGMLFTDSED